MYQIKTFNKISPVGLGRFDPEAKGLTKTLRITIPEDLDYDGVFDGLLKEYILG